MRPLAERCAQAGYSVELPRLPGHGTSLEDLVARRWPDFVEVALTNFDDLAQRCDKVAVVDSRRRGTHGVDRRRTPERRRVRVHQPDAQGSRRRDGTGLRDLIDSGLEILATDR